MRRTRNRRKLEESYKWIARRQNGTGIRKRGGGPENGGMEESGE
jgi:hypothetical protein